MIQYQSGGSQFLLKVFQMNGSVFPDAIRIALPCAFLTLIMTVLIHEWEVIHALKPEDSVMRETQAWGGFQVLVGFLIVFRTSQSYNRFWAGCTSTHRMRAEWFDGCSALVAFTKHSQADVTKIANFKNTLIRLFSMLHATALAAIEDSGAGEEIAFDEVAAFRFQLIDAEGIDKESLHAIRDSDAKVELVFQWIQSLIVENIRTDVLSIPPPILSRSFQEISNGMVAFHDAMKISYIPFPFPYAQTCDFLLIMHWLVTPFTMSQWIIKPWWAFVFSLIQVFILWALNLIAVELENPFGLDANDIDGEHMQMEMNQHLMLLLCPSTSKTPRLSSAAVDYSEDVVVPPMKEDGSPMTFFDVWQRMAKADAQPRQSVRRLDCKSLRTSSLEQGHRETSRESRRQTGAVGTSQGQRVSQAASLLSKLSGSSSSGDRHDSAAAELAQSPDGVKVAESSPTNGATALAEDTSGVHVAFLSDVGSDPPKSAGEVHAMTPNTSATKQSDLLSRRIGVPDL